MLENTFKITSKTKFSTPIVPIPSHLHPALSYSLHNELENHNEIQNLIAVHDLEFVSVKIWKRHEIIMFYC